MSESHHHRSQFKVPNRPFKGKSKASQKNNKGGRVPKEAPKRPYKAQLEGAPKEIRANRAKQLQKEKRAEQVEKKRLGTRQGAPKNVGIIALSPNIDTEDLSKQLYQHFQDSGCSRTNTTLAETSVNSKPRRFVFYTAPRETNAILDIAKAADVLVFVAAHADYSSESLDFMDDNDDVQSTNSQKSVFSSLSVSSTSSLSSAAQVLSIDSFGQHILSCLKAQGLPSTIGVIASPINHSSFTPLNNKKAAHIMKILNKKASRFFEQHFGNECKLMTMFDTSSSLFKLLHPNYESNILSTVSPSDAQMLLRFLSDMKIKEVHWRDQRAYMLAHQVAFIPKPGTEHLPLEQQKGCLWVKGFLRGKSSLSPNQLMHLTGYGDYQIAKLEILKEVATKVRSRSGSLSLVQSNLLSSSSSGAASAGRKMSRRDSRVELLNKQATPQPPTPVTNVAFEYRANKVLECPSEQRETLQSLFEIDPLATNAFDQSLITEDDFSSEALALSEQTENKTYDEAWKEAVPADVDEDEKQVMKAFRQSAKSNSAMETQSSGSQVFFDADAQQHSSYEEGMDDDLSQDNFEDDDVPLVSTPSAKDKKAAERDEQTNPDEVSYDPQTKLRERLARYRGLKSFQHSYWNKNLALPVEYGQIVQFRDFERTKQRVQKEHEAHYKRHQMLERSLAQAKKQEETTTSAPALSSSLNDMDDEQQPSEQKQQEQKQQPSLDEFQDSILGDGGEIVVVWLDDFSRADYTTLSSKPDPVVSFALFPYERKVSILHFLVKRHQEYTEPVKAKEEMEFHVGFRRFCAKPVFSQHNVGGTKDLTERFLQMGRFTVASIYANVQYPPSTVLMFMKDQPLAQREEGECEWNALVASGTLQAVDPNRLLIKRIILTGHPISVHKRGAVVRHMFFNPEDIRYFRPVEMWTKEGLVGHIREPRGTKGYMKCSFDGFIKNNDTVCMSLYKRQFPKWEPERFTKPH